MNQFILSNVSIRYRHNDGNTVISAKTGVLTGKCITSNTIPGLLKNGERVFFPFAGAINKLSNTSNIQKVKLVGIISVWMNEFGFGEPYSIAINDCCLGYYLNDCFYLALEFNRPVHWPRITQAIRQRTDNVIYLPFDK